MNDQWTSICHHLVVMMVTMICLTMDAVARSTSRSGGNRTQVLCCTLCRNIFDTASSSSINCTYDYETIGNHYARCGAGGSHSATNGLLSEIRLPCDDAVNNSRLYQCYNKPYNNSTTAAPDLRCNRKFEGDLVRINCTWLLSPSSPERADGNSCGIRISSSPPILILSDSPPQSTHHVVASAEPSCAKKSRCSMEFVYQPVAVDNFEHCAKQDLLTFTTHFGRTGIPPGTLTYALDRSASYDASGVNVSVITTNIDSSSIDQQEELITVKVPRILTRMIYHFCLNTSRSDLYYCHSEVFLRTNVTSVSMVLSYGVPMQFASNGSDVFCRFDKAPAQFLQRHEIIIKVRFYVAGYESGIYSYIPKDNNNLTTIMMMADGADHLLVPSPHSITTTPSSITFFAVASCVLAIPALCGLVLFSIWFRKHCTTPCALYKKYIAKRRLRRTADWVTLVQTQWSRKSTGMTNSDFQPSTPPSIITDRSRHEQRSICWPEYEHEDEYEYYENDDRVVTAPSLKRPLMRTRQQQQDDFTTTDQPPPPAVNFPCDHHHHEPLSAVSSAMDAWYSSVSSSAGAAPSDRRRRQCGYCGELYFHDPLVMTDDFGSAVGGNSKNSDEDDDDDDEISFITAFDVDPKSMHFLEACAKGTVEIV